MQWKALSVFAGVLGLVLAGCGDNNYQQPGYGGYPPGGATVSGGTVVTGGGQTTMGPNGQIIPPQPGAGVGPGGLGSGPGPTGQPIAQGANQPYPGQGQGGLVDGPVVSPNQSALDPNGSANPNLGGVAQQPGGVQQPYPQTQNGQRPYPQQQNGQQPLPQNGQQSYPQQPQPIASPQGRPSPSVTDYRQQPGVQQPGTQQPGVQQPVQGAQNAGDYQQALTYFNRMQVYDDRSRQMVAPFSGQSYVTFTQNLYRKFPSFRLQTFHQQYQRCHQERIYGMRAVTTALERMGCYDRDLFIDIRIN